MSRLDDDHRAQLLAAVAPAEAAAVVEQMPEAQVTEALEQLEPGLVAAILSELPDADRADLLEGMDEPTAEAILGAMTPDDARATRRLREYPSDVAGGLMTSDYLAFPENATVAELVEDLRVHAERYRDFVV